jgi:hypothetical protein
MEDKLLFLVPSCQQVFKDFIYKKYCKSKLKKYMFFRPSLINTEQVQGQKYKFRISCNTASRL